MTKADVEFSVFCAGLACVLFWPWAIVLVDLGLWAVTGVPWTSIPWDQTRGMVLVLWPVVGVVVLFIVLGLLAA
jgi:hypothetical protein